MVGNYRQWWVTETLSIVGRPQHRGYPHLRHASTHGMMVVDPNAVTQRGSSPSGTMWRRPLIIPAALWGSAVRVEPRRSRLRFMGTNGLRLSTGGMHPLRDTIPDDSLLDGFGKSIAFAVKAVISALGKP